MTASRSFGIAVLPGDGIGPEVIDATVPLLERFAHGAPFALHFSAYPGGALHYKATGDALPEATFAAAERPTRSSSARWAGRRSATPTAPRSRRSSTCASGSTSMPACGRRGRCPACRCRCADPRARDIDLVVVRESTEGLFASRRKGEIIDDREARDTMVITRAGSERLHDFAFRLAQRRKRRGHAGRVTCVDKANVFRSMAFFRRVFDERAARFPEIEADHHYVDATALDLIRKPWIFDVLVTENMFGDILSDQAAALVGGMGMAPSGDIGDDHGLFQPCHGSAPDIAGQGMANPTATILSAAMMLDWLADRSGVEALAQAALRLERAVDAAFAGGTLRPYELGGRDGTRAIADAVASHL